ncbi:membrane protein [Gordoniibacillus kamchatkensis]|uniref:Membrane protein n=1 Tax=Gordoniibacillus kamchatkensis TaxID=1590651 RepID=A0ABR5AKK7_9BACL|nr:YIEGIA family protein [Paenibacillus sp. VKM B-2647]KIL41529.1 membrane protein [Paenibacillus sp. VKM B-2647]
MTWHYLTESHTLGVIIGIFFGVLARIIMLQTDYHQYPSYPHGTIIHISLGVIAAGLGAVAVPALLDKNYTAVTFLGVAAQQFRDVRNMERQSLAKIDEMELVPRGATYIEGIAMVFEGRNYLVIFAAFLSASFAIVAAWYWGIAVGLVTLFISLRFKSGKHLGQIADIEPAEVRIDGPDLYVGDIYIMNVGLKSDREAIAKHGVGLMIKPKNRGARITIANPGQRQALLHDISSVLGIYKDEGEPALLPMARLNMNDGRMGVFLLPQQHDPRKAQIAAQRVPVLENAVRLPKESKANGAEAGGQA